MAISVFKESKLLAKHSIIYSLGNFMQRIVSLLLLPIYTRYLTPNDYGIKELVALSTDIIVMLLTIAISDAIYRFYFKYENIKDRNEVISSAIIVISIVGLFAIVLLSFSTKLMAHLILDSAELYYFFLIAFASLWFQSLNNIGYTYLRAEQKSLKFVTLSFCKMVLAILLNICLVCYLKLGVLGILISTLIVSIIMTLVLVAPLSKKIGLHFSANKIKEMLKFGAPLIPSQFGAFIVHLSDRFFIKEYCSIADAGLYSLGYRFGTLPMYFISQPFNQIFQPRRFELYKNDGSEKIFGTIFTYFLGLMVFAGLGVSVLSKDLLMIMSDEKFWSAYKVIPIIVLATTIFSFQYHLDMGILITKKTIYLAYINFSNGILILILNFMLIPKYGVYGAAYATLIAFIYKISLTYYFSSRYYQVHFELIRIIKIFLAAILIYTITIGVVFDSNIISFIVKSAIILLYPGLLLFFNFLSQEEKDKINGFLKPRFIAIKERYFS